VLSHGTGGSAQIMSWLGSGLAARGYVVAAVNHPGNNALEEYTAEGFLVWWERARDLSATIDFVLHDATLSAVVDRRRIGAAGFSLGGYTMFEIAGARTNLVLFQKYCSAEAEACQDPPEFPLVSSGRQARRRLLSRCPGPGGFRDCARAWSGVDTRQRAPYCDSYSHPCRECRSDRASSRERAAAGAA
jgi:predicted dienelactone hydrolase